MSRNGQQLSSIEPMQGSEVLCRRNEADPGENAFIRRQTEHYDQVARRLKTGAFGGRRYYQQRLSEVYAFLVPPGSRVLEAGCGQGDLIAALSPSDGVGVDISAEMICNATDRHPDIRFYHSDIREFEIEEKFDFIVLSDLVNDLWDVQLVFRKLRALSHSRTRWVMNFYSHLWEIPLNAAQRLGIAMPTPPQNWLTVPDVENLLDMEGIEVLRSWSEVLMPLKVPLLSSFANRFLVKIWPLSACALTNFILSRPKPRKEMEPSSVKVSVVIPARNEAGNIPDIFSRTPEMGAQTELIFVEGHSEDATGKIIEEMIARHPERPCTLLRQHGKGKGDAVRLGFAHAGGDVLMILDADLSVPPETLPRFFETLCSGSGDFINGVRLVYPMEEKAMRFFNLFGNKFFSLAFSWLLGQPIKDTLCGTKVLRKKDYESIEANRSYFGDFDPFGDFDLIFGAVKHNLKIVDLPIRYRMRTYGDTNIKRWKHGWLLFKMMCFAAVKIKFI